jgi:ubiquinol-cytochrome c reductase cytochrome c subunit
MSTFAMHRRHPAAAVVVMLFGLTVTGLLYAAFDGSTANAATSETQIAQGKMLFQEGCATCHGTNGAGTTDAPNIQNVGAAGAHFQIMTGRMPMATNAQQSRRGKPQFTEEQAQAIAAYVGSLGNGPAIPTPDQYAWENADLAQGGEVFRTNCAQCHSFSGQGGALTWGKAAPNLMKATPIQIYEAMISGPNNMPIFSDKTITPADKAAVIKYIETLKTPKNPGGLDLGRTGPVTEGLFLWTVGFGVLIAVAVWIGVKAK